jgi:hypothetical protein
MFPADWSRERIVEEIDSAWNNRRPHEDPRKCIGKSTSGVIIEGYLTPRTTAFPVYKKSEKRK